jgi:hypothetical protein
LAQSFVKEKVHKSLRIRAALEAMEFLATSPMPQEPVRQLR